MALVLPTDKSMQGWCAVRSLLPEGIAVTWMTVGGTTFPRYPEEAVSAAQALRNRRLEFAAGRACARRALVELGEEPTSVSVGADRSPMWPDRVVGSITHTGSQCFVAVGLASDYVGIGIDAEPQRPLPGGVLDLVCTASERTWIAARRDALAWDTLLFTIKECVYKAWYPVASRWLGFADVEVTVDVSAASFSANLVTKTNADVLGGPLHGRFTGRDGLWMSALAVVGKPLTDPKRLGLS